jgi:hypothetical protein
MLEAANYSAFETLRDGRPVCDAHQSKIFGSGIPIMSPPGPNNSDA